MNLNFKIVANNTVPVQFTVLEAPPYLGAPPGPPIDITGFTIKWSVFSSVIINGVLTAVGAALITKSTGAGSIVLTNPTSGIFTVSLNNTDTVNLAAGAYIHEAVTTNTNGNPVTIVNNDPAISCGIMTIRQQYTVQ